MARTQALQDAAIQGGACERAPSASSCSGEVYLQTTACAEVYYNSRSGANQSDGGLMPVWLQMSVDLGHLDGAVTE